MTPIAAHLVAPLAKLRGRSPRELADRLAHRVRLEADRRRAHAPTVLPIDGPAAIVPVPTLDRAALRAALGDEGCARVLARADAVRARRFPLLGHDALDYGDPPDWHRDPISGRRAPLVHWSRVPYLDRDVVGDHKVTWELNRHQWLLHLAQAHRLTGDERYATDAAQLLAHWLDANPPHTGMNWTSALELAFRCIAWTHALALFGDTPALPPTLRHRLAGSIHDQLAWVAWNLSTWFSPNTHLTGEALALHLVGCAWPTLPDAAAWRRTGWSILVTEATARQLRPDGSYFEQTSWYQGYTVDFYTTLLRWAARTGTPVPDALRARVHDGARLLRALAADDGTIPLVGDDDGGALLPLGRGDHGAVADILAAAAVVLDDPSLDVPAAPADALVWLGLVRHPGRAPAPGGRLARDGGWLVLRDRDALGRLNRFTFDTGPHGALTGAHAHADALAVTLHVHGHDLVVDPGTRDYDGPDRRRYRATAMHATVTVDGVDSSEQGTAFRWRTATDAELGGCALHPVLSWADAWHDGYARLPDPVRHRRTIGRLHRRYWFMLDTMTCATPHAVALALPCAPTTSVTRRPDDRGALLARDGVGVQVVGDGTLAWTVDSRTISPAYGIERPAPALVGHATIGGATSWCTVIASIDEAPDLRVEAEGERRWRIAHAHGEERLVAPLGEPCTLDGLVFDGTLLCVTTATDGVARAIAAGRGTLVADGVHHAVAADATLVLERAADGWRAVEG